MPSITIDEAGCPHTYRGGSHFREDTDANRQLLIEVANKGVNFLGTDRAGNDWYAENRADGTQVWVRVRSGKIVNGGMNHNPRDFTGLPR
jgi:hypothetical protein